MFRTDVATAAGVIPVPAAAGTPGYFTNGNPGTSTPSTVVDADWLNMVQEELLAIATALGAAASKTVRNQVLIAIQQMIQQHGSNFAADSGAANAYVGVFAPVITAHVNGMEVRLFIANANSGASTLNAGPGAKNILRLDGSALAAGDIPANSFARFTYRASNDSWYLSSTSQNFAAVAIQQQAGNFATAGGTANAITATYSPAVGAHVQGMPLRVKLTASNSGAVTFNPGPGVVSVVNSKGGALVSGDLVNGEIVEFNYDGTNYQYLKVPQVATQAEMEAASDTSKIVTAGRQHFHPSAVKAWVEYDNNGESGTTEATFGVSSVTDVGVGTAGVNFSTSFSSVAYAVLTGASGGTTGAQAQGLRVIGANKAVGSCRLEAFSVTDAASIIPDLDYNFAGFTGDV